VILSNCKPLKRGGAFRAIAEQVSYLNLTEIRRQELAWQQTATRDFALAHTAKALQAYRDKGHVRAYASDKLAVAAMIEQWQATAQQSPEKSQLLLAYTREAVQLINQAAQAARRDKQELGHKAHLLVTERGEQTFYKRDRLYFLRNNPTLGVKNGTRGVIKSIRGDHLTVLVDAQGEKRTYSVRFSLKDYCHIDLGYAATVHKAQGVTVDCSYILASKYFDRHLAYVAMSRHREVATLFYSETTFNQPGKLDQRLQRAQHKTLTLDFITTPEPARHAPEQALNAQTVDLSQLASLYVDEIALANATGWRVKRHAEPGDQGLYRGEICMGVKPTV